MKPKVAVGHPFLGRGGSEATAMWLIQSIKEDFDVSLVTTSKVNLTSLNGFYGTDIKPDELKIRVAPRARVLPSQKPLSALRQGCFSAFARRIGSEFDLCITAYNIVDWGRPGIHLIGDFQWDQKLCAELYGSVIEKNSNSLARKTVRKLYSAICRVAEGRKRSLDSFFDGSEIIVANSKWTDSIIREKYAYSCEHILYPPVNTDFQPIPWEKKKPGFVSIGRIDAGKRIEDQVEILKRIRSRGHDIVFDLIGHVGDDAYGRSVRKLCSDFDWITLHGRKSGKEKERLLTGCKYAIHTNPYETFGITIAEFVNAGAIPFIPNMGGQTEIVPLSALQFGNIEEAERKIDAVLKNASLEQEMLRELAGIRGKLTIQQFKKDVRAIVG